MQIAPLPPSFAPYRRDLVDIHQAAAYLGRNTAFVRRLVAARSLPHYKVVRCCFHPVTSTATSRPATSFWAVIGRGQAQPTTGRSSQCGQWGRGSEPHGSGAAQGRLEEGQ